MRAFVIKQLGHPSKVELTTDAPDLKPVPGRLLVDVYSAGLNFYDVSMHVYSDHIITFRSQLWTSFRFIDLAGSGETPE